ncbi:hypothetical protein MNB_SV-12-566 [hydrothermal vent metagenome]|uniref:Translocation and assembly module TamB C-terminal domain-containing protein n=1 Tax=hydrothermal vent metagenome TaxID=652676 RepID=A0A1W1CP74_9ZZZZ
MVLIEILLILGTILLFVITDSRTINIATKDILREYGISYKKISGNLFTGIEVSSLKYNGRKLVNSATIYWNPFALGHNRVHITKLELQGVELEGIISALETLPKSDDKESEKPTLFFDLLIDKISLTVNPFVYHGVEFKNFYFGMLGLAIDRDMQIKSKTINFLVDSDLVNLSLRGKIEQNSLNLDSLRLLEIDPKVITSFVKSIKKEQKNKKDKNQTNSSSGIALGDITVDNFFATMKKTTYGPVTIDKTKIIAQNLSIDPKNGFEYSANSASISTDTNFASTKQVGYIKNSLFYGRGDILTKKYLYDKYSLPLNQKELKRIPAKLKVNHKGVWVEIEDSIKDILVLKNSNFNVNLKKVKHKFDYLYSDFFIKITSEGVGAMTYADDVKIKNIVDIDFRNRGKTKVVYSGEVKLKKLKNIPKKVSQNLLENLKAKYRGTPKELIVTADSKQIKGTFFTDGYKDAKLKIDSKGTLPLVNLLKGLPKGTLGEIQSNSYIDFFDSSKTKIGLDIDSNLINLKTSMGIKKPFKIDFSASIPKNSKISDIDKRIRVENISTIDGKVILDRDITHISLFNEDLKLSFDYNKKRDRFSRGLIKVADEQINFNGSLSSKIDIKTHIKNMNKFRKTINRYYDIKLPKMSGRADIDMKFNADSSLNIFAKSKNIGYMDFKGDIETTININKDRVVDIEFKSKKLNYNDIEFHTLSGKLSITGDNIEIDRYDFKFYNDYISHFYSNKKSYLSYRDGVIYVDRVWIKERALVHGQYDINTLKGKFAIASANFSFKNSDFDLVSRYDLVLKLDGKRLFIDGTINPLGNTITYEAVGSGISEDNDIMIVQELREKEKSPLNNIKMRIAVENDKPLKYITDNINIEFTNSLILIKDYNKDLKILGTTTIKSGYYQKEDKRFYLDESHIYFSGDPQKPLLEIKATYIKEQYNIQIFISGTTDDPIINFNSDPYLTQKEILSLILFDSTGNQNRSGTELYALLGGTFAKELMKSLGISVDHLLLGQGIDERLSVEIGEKISDNITVIYQHNNDKDGVKVQVDHSDSFETDIILQPPNSSSIEFLYKSD